MNASKPRHGLTSDLLKLVGISLMASLVLTAQASALPRLPGTQQIYGYPSSSFSPPSEEDENLLNEMQSHLDSGNLPGAESAIRQFLKRDPGNIERARYIAYRLMNNDTGNDNALDWLKHVLDYKQANSKDYYYFAYFQSNHDNYASVLYYAQQGLARNPDAYLRLGIYALMSESYLNDGYLTAAREYFNKFKATLKNLPPATGKGNEFIEEVGHVRTSLAVKAYDAEPSHEIWDESRLLELDYLNWAIRSAPTEAVFYAKRGKYFEDKKDFKRAYQDYSKAIQLDPGDRHSLSNKSYLLMRELNSPRSAIEGYSKLITVMEKLAESKELDEFEEHERAHYYAMRAYTYYDLDDCEHALQDMMKACEYGYEDGCTFTCRL